MKDLINPITLTRKYYFLTLPISILTDTSTNKIIRSGARETLEIDEKWMHPQRVRFLDKDYNRAIFVENEASYGVTVMVRGRGNMLQEFRWPRKTMTSRVMTFPKCLISK